MIMAENRITDYRRADVSFLKGFEHYRFGFRRDIFIHSLQTLLLLVLLPIDPLLLTPGFLAIPAIAIAMTASLVSVITLLIQHYIIFQKYGLLGFCQLARDTMHVTEEKVGGESQEECTDKKVLHSETGVSMEGVDDKTIEIYANMAKFEIERTCEQRFPSLNCFWRIEYFTGCTGMIAVVALMAAGNSYNPAEIAVLCIYLLLEAYCRWIFLIVAVLIALAPLICLFFTLWICCCGPKEGQSVLDLEVKKAEPEDIVKCDGECAICLMSIDPNSKVYGLPCSQKHIFHSGCLEKWAQVKLTCPTCRKELPFKNVVVNAGQGVPIQD